MGSPKDQVTVQQPSRHRHQERGPREAELEDLATEAEERTDRWVASLAALEVNGGDGHATDIQRANSTPDITAGNTSLPARTSSLPIEHDTCGGSRTISSAPPAHHRHHAHQQPQHSLARVAILGNARETQARTSSRPKGMDSPGLTSSPAHAPQGLAGSPAKSVAATDSPHSASGASSSRLPRAARDGRLESVEALLQAGMLVSEKDRRGRTALHWAAAKAHREIAVLLLESGADPASEDRDGITPLHLASVAAPSNTDGHYEQDHNGTVAAVDKTNLQLWHSTHAELAIPAGESPVTTPQAGALHPMGRRANSGSLPTALSQNTPGVAMVEILIRSGAPLEHIDHSGRTPLHFAAWRGQAGPAQALLRHRANTEAVDNDGRTPLHLAAIAGNLLVLEKLLASGALTEEEDPAGRTAVHLAAYWGQPKAIKDLFANGANLEAIDHDGATALQLACWQGQDECALRRHGATLDKRNTAGLTAYHLAAAEGHMGALTELMKAGAGLDIVDAESRSLLHVACEAGQTQVAEFLLKQGANTEVVDTNWCTPLHLCALQGHAETVNLLLRHGADVTVTDESLCTALHFAAAEGHRQIATALIKAGADVGSHSMEPIWTPLHQAAQAGHAPIVRLLISHGSLVDRLDRDGRTALQIASLHRQQAVVALLASRRALARIVSQESVSNAGSNGNGFNNQRLLSSTDITGPVAAVMVAVRLEQLRALLYCLSNIAISTAQHAQAASGLWGMRRPHKGPANLGLKRMPMSPHSPSESLPGGYKPDFDLSTALEPPSDVEPDLHVDFVHDVKPFLGKRLGEGAFGVVYAATWQGQQVAIKVMSRAYKGTDRKEQFNSFAKEVQAMSHVGQGCKRIVRMLGACLSRPRVCIIYELLQSGCLHSRIHDKLRSPLDILEVLSIAHDVAEGLAYLHHVADTVHRDLKPQNILLDSQGRAKIIDFGLSKDVANPCQSYLLTDARGTIQYMSPEAFDCKGGFKADVYALGVIINECFTREVPWEGYDLTYQVMYAVTAKDDRPPLWADCPPDLARLITKCWHKDPDIRPGCHEIMHLLRHLIKEVKRERGLIPPKPPRA